MNTPMKVTGVVFLGVVLIVGIIWVCVSGQNYTQKCRPGENYRVGSHVFKIPDLPARTTGTTATKDTVLPVLSEKFMKRQHELMRGVHALMVQLKIPYFVSGGTLIGAVRHGTTIPWDDDLDIHTTWKHRRFLFSSDFADTARQHNLEVIVFRGTTMEWATRESAAVRLRLVNTTTPVCDVFFEKHKSGDTWGKVDSWFGKSITFNSKEEWHKSWIWPLQETHLGDMTVFLPHQPENMLNQQYGQSWKTELYFRPLVFSHEFPFKVLSWVWRRQ